jgi:hypothetical protein
MSAPNPATTASAMFSRAARPASRPVTISVPEVGKRYFGLSRNAA